MSINSKNMHALAIGPQELISGLAAFGVEVQHAADKENALSLIQKARSEQKRHPYALIFLTESIATSMNEEEYEMALGSGDLPVVLTIPDLASKEDAGLEKLSGLTKRAVGVDIFGS